MLRDRSLWTLVVLGLGIRLAHLAWGATWLFGADIYHSGDTVSFTNSFRNLWHFGTYSWSLDIPQAAYGRLPGYPIFWGIHFLVFGEAFVDQAVALTQTLLDTSSIILVFSLLKNLTNSRGWSLTGSFVYTLYPFVMVWNSKVVAETLSSFLTLLFLATLLSFRGKFKTLAPALIAVTAFYVRPYLGVFLPLGFVYILLAKKDRNSFRAAILFSLAFTILYLPWPFRNYVNHQTLCLLRAPAAGYPSLGQDFIQMRKWVNCWGHDSDRFSQLHERLVQGQKPIELPLAIFASEIEQRKATELFSLYQDHSSSYRHWVSPQLVYSSSQTQDREHEIASGFDELRDSFRKREPLAYYLRMPLANFRRAIFKTSLFGRSNSKAIKLGLAVRSLFVLLGLAAIFFHPKNSKVWLLWSFAFSVYFLVCAVVRHVEMRYFLQADLALFVLAFMTIKTLVQLKSRQP